MTNALFSVMDRRGDGVITRDEFNEMAFTAIHNNPLVGPARTGLPLAPTLGPAPMPAPRLAAAPAPTFGLAPMPAPAKAPAPAPAPAFAPAVSFGGMTFMAPPAGAPLPMPAPAQPQPQAAPASASWALSETRSSSFGLGGTASSSFALGPPPPASPAGFTESTFLAAPAVPGVTATAPTASTTNALFTAMDRRGDGILTRDEWNQMAYTAVHNNPLVRPGRPPRGAAGAFLPTGQVATGPSAVLLSPGSRASSCVLPPGAGLLRAPSCPAAQPFLAAAPA